MRFAGLTRVAVAGVLLAAAGSCLTSFPDPRGDRDSGAADANLDVLVESGGLCEGGGKLCGETCVPTDDPAFGCATAFCNACSLPNTVEKCSAGACAVGACEPGFDDCDQMAENGCESELAVDPDDCGACDHGCGGAGCSDGKCLPIVIAPAQSNPWGVAVDATHVYWTNAGGTVGLARKAHSDASGAPEPLFASGADEGAVALDDQYVYWANDEAGLVRRLPKQNPSAAPLTIASAPTAIGVAVDDEFVYWTAPGTKGGSDGSVSRTPKAGGASTVLASAQSTPWLIALDATHVYWTSLSVGSVHRVPKLGGSAVELAGGSDPTPSQIAGWGVVVHQASVLWLDNPLLRRVPAGGGGATTVRDDHPQGRFIALFGSDVAWAAGLKDQGRIWLGSASDPAQAVELVGGIDSAHGVALDASYVYFSDWGSTSESTDGAVYKVRRPW